MLIDRFVDQFNHQRERTVTGLSRDAMVALMCHDWPGNVRELENAIEQRSCSAAMT